MGGKQPVKFGTGSLAGLVTVARCMKSTPIQCLCIIITHIIKKNPLTLKIT